MSTLFNTFSGVCVIFIAVLQFTKVFETLWGKWVILGLAAVAVLCVLAAAIFTSREGRARERREEERDRRFEELAGTIIEMQDQSKPSSAPAITSNSDESLRSRTIKLGHDLFAFLREKGPRPETPLNHLRNFEEKWKAVMDANGPYVEGIHYGYQHRFKQRVVDMFNELAENGIHDRELEAWELDPPQVAKAETIRKIAEHLFLIATKMDIADASRGT